MLIITSIIIWTIIVFWSVIEIKGIHMLYTTPGTYYPIGTVAVTCLWVICLSLWTAYFISLRP